MKDAWEAAGADSLADMAADELLKWLDSPPPLRRPVLLIALDGFIDAGSVASSASMFLRHRWLADMIAEFDGDAFIDYRARRPRVVVDNGVVRSVDWPRLQLFTARTDGPHDVTLLLGPEPDMRWGAFVETVAQACGRLGIELAVTLGAYPAATPHTRPIGIVRATNTLGSEAFADIPGVTGYTGPVGAATALQAALVNYDIPTVGLWAEVPHYIAGSPHPPGALALVRRLAKALQIEVDTTELEAAAKLHLEQVDDAVAEHEEAVAMVTGLERLSDSEDGDDPLPTGDDLAAEIERFLRSGDE